MINNEYISPYHRFNISNGVPVKFMELFVQVDDMDSSNFIDIQIDAKNASSHFQSRVKIQYTYEDSEDTYTINPYYMPGSDNALAIFLTRDGNKLNLYAKINTGGLLGFARVISSFNNQYKFTNVNENPDQSKLITINDKSIYTFPDYVTVSTTYTDNSYSNESYFSINVGFAVTTEISDNNPILNTSNIRGNGMMFNTSTGQLYPVRISSTKCYAPSQTIPTGNYILKINGVKSGSRPTLS